MAEKILLQSDSEWLRRTERPSTHVRAQCTQTGEEKKHDYNKTTKISQQAAQTMLSESPARNSKKTLL
jgi:hypothetical protein